MSQTMIAMLEEAEDVLRRVGCDMTAANIRKVLQAQQAEPRCACGDSFTSDAVCANCLTAQKQAEPVAWFYSDNFDKQDNLYRRTTVRDVAEGFARQGRRVIAQYDAAQPPAQQQAESVAPAVKESLTAQPEPVALSLPFFAYDSETGFERFATEAEAKQYVQDGIDECRSNMLQGEAWPSEIEKLCWGVVLGGTKEIKLGDAGDGSGDYYSDYVLTDAAQPPAVAGAVPDGLRKRCVEILNWQKKGVLEGDELRKYASEQWYAKEHNCLQLAETDTAREVFTMLAAAPQAADPIKRLIAMHNELLGEYPYCYFELAYTRRTDWMAWLCTKPRDDDPERKVLACGQGLTAEEACAEAIRAAQNGGEA